MRSRGGEGISKREREIAAAYAAGASYREIATRLCIAPTTVRTHLSAIYRKLGVSSKIALLRALEEERESVEAAPPRRRIGWLPAEMTDLVGRTEEEEAVCARAARHRLSTLLGPGGIGKSRLALRAARRLADRFEDGAFFVSLEAVRSAEEVPAAVARVLGLHERGGQPLDALVVSHLGPRRVLLVLDNFEHVLDAAPWLAELLSRCEGVTALVTSRARLRLSGESCHEVPPLSLPETASRPEDVARSPAAALFSLRAGDASASFTLDRQNCGAVARIVAHLDGLPLAIELAAAQLRYLSPAELEHRLGLGLSALGEGPVDVPERHRGLASALRWSYDLLGPMEQAMFRRLAVFVGEFTADAAAQIARDASLAAPEAALRSLIDHSLVRVRADGTEARYSLFQTVRGFALELVAEAGELEAVQTRHAGYFARLVERHYTGEGAARHSTSLARISRDEANIREALAYFERASRLREGLRLAMASWRYWHATGQPRDGMRFIELFLRGAESPEERALARLSLAHLAYWRADYAAAAEGYQEALDEFSSLGSRKSQGDALLGLSTTATWAGDPERGKRLATRAQALFLEVEAHEEHGLALMAEGFALWMQGRLEPARRLWERSQAIAEASGDWVEAAVKNLAIASIDTSLGREDAAIAGVAQALDKLRRCENVSFQVMALDWVAALLAPTSPRRATMIAGFVQDAKDRIGGGMSPSSSGLRDARDVCGEALPEATFAELMRRGRALQMEEAMDQAACMIEAWRSDVRDAGKGGELCN